MMLKDVDMNKVSPMMKQYIEVKKQYPDVIIMYRIGDFFETFFEDALLVSRELELTLTGRNAGLEERVPMCGVPHHAVSSYVDALVNKGYKVGLCDQLEDPAKAQGLVERGLTQIISRGTIVNTDALNSADFNYIGSLIDFNHAYVLVYTDITTGEINAKILPHHKTNLISEIISLGLKEVVFESSIDRTITDVLAKQFKISITYNDNFDASCDYKYIYEDIEDERIIKTLKLLLTYVTLNQQKVLTHFQKLVIKENKNYLKMDVHTKRNLELTETLRLKERNYSLIWLLDKTKTAFGSRMLKNYIENPLVDIKEINKRYDIVETLLEEFILKEDLKELLNHVYDLERLSGKIAFGNANGRDLLQLKSSLKVLPDIQKILKAIKFKDIETFDNLYTLLEKSIYEDAPVTLHDGYLIKDGYNSELDELKELRRGGKDFVAKFEATEREKTGIKTLKVGYNKVFGYYIEVSKGAINQVKEEYGYERKQTLANAERYISPILKEKEAMILNAEERITELEYELFIAVRDEIKKHIPSLQKTAHVLAEIDVLLSFALVAEENNYVRPQLIDKHIVKITENRHAVVEKVLANHSYVANDINMDEDTNILLITGPNMAGKSTYMRQFAITVIMAQIGSFVPAKEAIMPVFDAIYTRIGASDDLVSGESTFMVEMNEANVALSNATENSLVLFDELGRGTATFDGMALAQAIIEYIHTKNCKTMFSTHYHELTDLDQTLDKLKNIHVSAHEENGNVTFLHKIKEGSIDKSYGIHVAKLAGLPNEVLNRAEQVLKIYEGNEQRRDIKVQESLPLTFEPQVSEIEKKLKEIDILKLTPLEALNILDELKKDVQ